MIPAAGYERIVLHFVMATALALIAASIFAVSTVLQQKGGLKAPPLSVRHPGSFVHLAGQGAWLIGMALQIPGWTLQAMEVDHGRGRDPSRSSP